MDSPPDQGTSKASAITDNTLQQEKLDIDVTSKPRHMARILKAADKAKISLSSVTSTIIEVDNVGEGRDFKGTLQREEYDQVSHSIRHSSALNAF